MKHNELIDKWKVPTIIYMSFASVFVIKEDVARKCAKIPNCLKRIKMKYYK